MPQCPCCKKWVSNYCLECDGHPDTKALAKANARIRELEEAGAVLAEEIAARQQFSAAKDTARETFDFKKMHDASNILEGAIDDRNANPTAAAMVKAAQVRAANDDVERSNK